MNQTKAHPVGVSELRIQRSIPHRLKERLHFRRVINAASGKCGLGPGIGLPVVEGVARPTHLHVLNPLACRNEGIDEFRHLLLHSGWQGDVTPRPGAETIKVPIAGNPDGSSIT